MSLGVTQTKVYAYEVALFGEFFPRDLKAILNRITLHSESAAPMHTREVVFEQLGIQGQSQPGSQSQADEPVLLRARKEVSDGRESRWSVKSMSNGLNQRALQDPLLVPQAGVGTRASRGDSPPVGNM